MKIFRNNQPFQLESGITLPQYHLAYHTYGTLNETKDNVIWIFHALTANSDAASWWSGLVGTGTLFDPSHYFIVCVNMPGSCYGSTGPLDIHEKENAPFFHSFPFFTTRDMIRAYRPLLQQLGIRKIHTGIGGSMGGQQLLEWAIEEPALFQHIVPIATNAAHSPWGKAFNTTQRMCIELDPTWVNRNHHAGLNGMQVARGMALLSYRSFQTYKLYQSDDSNELLFGYKSGSYQRYQGAKLVNRFNAFSYHTLTKSMDAHNVGRGRPSIVNALTNIQAKTLVIGILSDLLFQPEEQRFLVDHIPNAECRMIQSDYGHDGFLLETEKIGRMIKDFLTHDWNGKKRFPNYTFSRPVS